MCGQFEKAISIYLEMVGKCMYASEDASPFALRSFCCLGKVENRKSVHGYLVKLGLDSCRLMGSALEGFIRQSGDKTDDRCRYEVESFRPFKRMGMESVELNSVTLINLSSLGIEG